MKFHQTPLFALGGALALLAGCATEPESHVVSAPPPASPIATTPVVAAPQPQQVIVTQPQPQQVVTTVAASGATTSYVVLQAPPAPQAPQAVPTQPSSSHVWIDGYWTWRNNRYEWMAGHWEVPPFAGAKWVAPHSETQSGAIRFYEGHWI
jgi:WXXGXW repeat (2 copies)